MKALSIRQPWAWAICAGYKDVENRDWPTNFRGRVLVHAGIREEREDVDFVAIDVARQTGRDVADVLHEYQGRRWLGAIVGAVTITDCVTAMQSSWFFGKYGFVLTAGVALAAPIPCKGRLGFFAVPDDVRETICALRNAPAGEGG